MSREDIHFRLHMHETLKYRVEKAARENKRSLTAEILDRLEKSFSPVGLSASEGGLSPRAGQLRRMLEDVVIQFDRMVLTADE